MSNENNKMQVDIENLFKQNVNDLSAIKELYRKLKEVEEKISQIKYIDSNLANKLKKEYEKLKRIILDENVSATLSNEIEKVNENLSNEIETINEKLTNDIETINSQMNTFEKTIFDYVNILDYGAKLDGITDDSLALEKALNDGSVKLPSNCEIFIGNTVHINKKCRILDGNGATLYTNANTTAFEISQKYCSELIHNIDIKNFFVVMSKGGNFCTSYNSYFVNFSDLRLTGMNDNTHGIKIYNGFNVTFKNVHINGTKGALGTNSGNNITGIHVYLSSEGINTNLDGVINGTNFLVDSCLIQKCKYGILHEVFDGTFDTNKINNVGFSDCDFPFCEKGGNNSSFLNQQISMMRAEYCGTSITNVGYLSVNNLYNYNTRYTVNNTNENGIVSFSGTINHWCPNIKDCCIVYDNKGVLDFSKADNFSYTNGVAQKTDDGIFGKIIPLKTTLMKRNNGLTALTLNPFFTEIINQTTYINLATSVSNLINGNEFYMTSTADVTIDLPNGTSFRFSDSENTTLHFMVVDEKLTVLNQTAVFIKDDINATITGISANKIHFMNATKNISQYNFNELGIGILYSTTEGVTLSNGNNNILNFGNLNSNSPFELYNNPLIMIPLNDGTGKGLAIKC